MKYLPIILTIGTIILLIRVFRGKILKWLLYLRGKMIIAGVRQAIKDADEDKEKTDRKNIVVYNTVTRTHEPIQKKLLKSAANAGKNKNNAKMTDGRKRAISQQKKKPKVFTTETVKRIEDKSIYVTN